MATSAGSGTNSRDFEPLAQGWRSFAWPGGSFDTAFRPQTSYVEGRISLSHPTVITIIEGGCGHIEVTSECGHSYEGPDFAGSVSFVPPACGRDIRMTDVRSKWASLSIQPDFFRLGGERDDTAAPEVPTFTNRRDPFLHAMLVELERQEASDARLDGLYCEAMAISAAQYIMRRYGSAGHQLIGRPLPGWRLRRVADFVNANLGNQNLRVDDLARCVGLSTGFFHRAFRETTGETPLAYIRRLRLQRAMQLLACGDLSVLQIALEVGYQSPNHFSRLFHRQVGMTPSRYRRGLH